MKHRHHVKPKHSGGEDFEENLTPPIPVIRHAMFHWCEWQRTGNEFDRIAWLALSGQALQSEIIELKLKEAGRRRANQMEANKELFFDPLWQTEQAKKSAAKNLELNWESIVSRLRENVKSQLQSGTHPFQRQNRTWDQREVSKRSAQTQLEKGNHPFQGNNPNWDRSEAARKANKTQLLNGTHSSQTKDRGPNYRIVIENSDRIRKWWEENKTRKVANGRRAGPKTCNEELNLQLTSLQCLKNFLTSLNDNSYCS
jgi:hypothetical protein